MVFSSGTVIQFRFDDSKKKNGNSRKAGPALLL